MSDIHSRFKDQSSVDKSIQAVGAIDKATGLMKQNIGRMLESRQIMFDIEGKSGDLRDTASR